MNDTERPREWDDERIDSELGELMSIEASRIRWIAIGDAAELLRQMRDDLLAEADDVMVGQLRQARDKYEARIRELEEELAKWRPSAEVSGGVLSVLIDEANAPGEDEAWEYLQEDDG